MANPETVISVNGREHRVNSTVGPSVSLSDFLRENCGLKGTKVMCREGGCGCCVVVALKPGENKAFAVDSCLLPVHACDGWNVTTIEGLGSRKTGFHTIQTRLAELNGSQCGFCSPGMVMSMYGMLENKKVVTKEEAEGAVDGNLCRCTGYRAILDAVKSFASGTTSCNDIEDLAKCNVNLCQNPRGKSSSSVMSFGDGSMWYKPASMTELLKILGQVKDSKVRIVVGNTSVGFYKDDGPYEVYIDTKNIRELYDVSDTVTGTFSVGANLSLTKMVEVLTEVSSSNGFGYCASIAKHLTNVANVPVRNIGSWAGNLMTKYYHPDFPSDVFLLLAAVDAKVCIGQGHNTVSLSVENFLTYDMNGKVITKLTLKASNPKSILHTYKVMPNSASTHACVNAALFFDNVDENKCLRGGVRLFFGGTGSTGRNDIRAVRTEEYMLNKNVSDPSTVAEALSVLESEVTGCAEFKKNLCSSLLYKAILALLGSSATEKLRSGGETIVRPVMSGQQVWETDEKQWPLTQPMPRITAAMQASGEAEFVNDIKPSPALLHAAFVISTQGNAILSGVDASRALKQPGVLRYISADDVPGSNTIGPPINTPSIPEPIFCDGRVHYAGQAIGLIVAETQQQAHAAAKLVKVTYSDVNKPVVDVREAVEKKMFFKERYEELVKGDAAEAIKNSAKVIEGEITTGTQQHFPMETQACVCVPTEDLLYVYPTSQWISGVQRGVAHALGTTINKVVVEVRRLGGGFGSKIDRNNCVSVPCAVAAYAMNAPVKISLDLNTNMSMLGKRFPFLAKYRAGFSSEGKLCGVEMTYYNDCGYTDNTFTATVNFPDNVYHCENWSVTAVGVRTNTPANTFCRAPGKMQAVYFIECILEHIAAVLQKDPYDVRMLNLYQQGQVSPAGEVMSFFKVKEMMENLMNSADIAQRKASIAKFNRNNRWRKRGLSVVPTRMPIAMYWANYAALVSVYGHDGSVAIAHGGIEMGQGINTKAIQERIKPVKEEFPEANWSELINKCHEKQINLTAQHMMEESQYPSSMLPELCPGIAYNSYGVACTEVELDILTAERQINRVDILFDVGESINPMMDIGQIEGALAMAIGFFLFEEVKYDPDTGRNLSSGTWDYKVPTARDVPVDLRVQLINWAPNPLGLVRAKAIGEPPMLMCASVAFALKRAVEEARKEVGNEEYFELNTPVTGEKTFQLCLPNRTSYVI